jgi:hypothetical protein
MAIQIGKYKRPGIFIEEFDQSVITSPTVEGISTTVIGFSRKGPVNTPVLVQNLDDLEKIFGSLDRNLERKGSFFHRTISKMLESSPVLAVNLLLTDDNLDTIEYQSVSTSTNVVNDIKRLGPYRRFFDTTGFWKRDDQSFINLTTGNLGYGDKILNFTNLSDKFITVFALKSQVSGFDRSLVEWYGSADKLPSYLNANEWASDYMVDVIVVAGDWSNYVELAVDPKWSQYFNSTGLIKTQLRNFANDRNVNLLGYYEGLSLIPFFRDNNGRNVFIETVINRDVDRTGLFCAFNNDLFETDYPNGLVDLIGANLVDSGLTSFNFLSYNESIVENVTFTETYLDRPGNVIGLIGTYSLSFRDASDRNERHASFSEGYVDGLQLSSVNFGATSSTASVVYSSTNGYAVIGGNLVDLGTQTFSFSISPSDYTTNGTYSTTFVLTSSGEVTSVSTTTPDITLPSVNASDIVLGYVQFGITGGTSSKAFGATPSLVDITVGTAGYVELVHGTSAGSDYYIQDLTNGQIKVEFLDTAESISNSDYKKKRKLKIFNYLISVLDSSMSSRATMLINSDMEKKSVEMMSISGIVNNQTNNKSFVLNTGLSSGEYNDLLNGFIVLYILDDELILGSTQLFTKNTTATNTEGVVARYSSLYGSFFDGIINTGDYFTDLSTDLNHYLVMYIDSENNLTVKFLTEDLVSPELITDLDANTTFVVISEKRNFKQSVDIEIPSNYSEVPNKILCNAARYSEIRTGDFLEADYATASLEPGQAPRKLTRILSKRLFASDTTLVELTCDSAIKKVQYVNGRYQTTRYSGIENYVSTYKAMTLKGFRIRESSMPDGTEARQNAILNLVSKGTPMFKAITNKEAIDFRYLIDCFGLGLTERSKQQLVDICGARLDCLGFINMPSMRQFRNSTSPSFVDSEGVLQAEFIANGGDPESSPAFLYSFGEGAGSTSVGYFLPYLTVNDNGRPTDVPPAMFIATTYMRKLNSNVTSITPWTIAAGVTNGRITNISGVEMNFTPEDIEFLNQAQMNPIVFKRNRGHIIETENTAQTLFTSALSYLHVREVLIELERELSRMLLDFQWQFNTPEIRSEIKLRADVICETYVNRNGLFNYFNKCDEENNTPDVIDNQVGVLDTYVEPIKGMGVIVNNVTILRTGAIQSGGFINP